MQANEIPKTNPPMLSIPLIILPFLALAMGLSAHGQQFEKPESNPVANQGTNSLSSTRVDGIDTSVQSLLSGRPTITGTPTYLGGITLGYNSTINVTNADGTTSTTSVAGALWAGTIIAYGGAVVPSGWLECDGSSYDTSTYPTLYSRIGCSWGCADGTHFNIPDLRGVFIRGWNHGVSSTTVTGDPDGATRIARATGGNTGDNVGSYEVSTFTAHTHAGLVAFSLYTPGGTSFSGTNGQSGSAGGSETRPKNAFVMYIIKSDDSIGLGGGGAGSTVTGGTVAVTAPITGNGSAGNPLALATVPIAFGGTAATTAPGALTSLGAVALAGGTMTGALTVSGTSVTASAFFGDGSALTGIPSTGSISGFYLPLAGGTLTGASGITNAAFTATGASGNIIGASSITTTGGHFGRADAMTFNTGPTSLNTQFTAIALSTSNLAAGNATTYLLLNGANGMSGQFTTLSSATVGGSAMSVGGSSFTVSGGSATIAYNLRVGNLGVIGPSTMIGSVTFQGAFGGLGLSTGASVAASMYGIGTPSSPLGVLSSSVAVRNTSGFVENYQIDSSSVVKMISGFVPNFEIDPSSITKQGGFHTGNGSLLTAIGGVSVQTQFTAVALSTTNLAAGSATTYLKLDGTNGMSGQFTTLSSATVVGSAFSVGGSTLVVTSGRVGAGKTPTAGFEVSSNTILNGGLSFGGVNGALVPLVVRGTSTTGGITATIDGYGTGNQARLQFTDSAVYNYGIGTESNGDFSLRSGNSSSAAGTERMRVTQGGNVGIGTASPVTRLHSAFDTVYANDVGQIAASDSTNILKRTVMGFDGTANIGFITAIQAGSDYKSLVLQPNGGASGKVGIANTNPQQALDVTGTIRQSAVLSCANGVTTNSSGDINGCASGSGGGVETRVAYSSGNYNAFSIVVQASVTYNWTYSLRVTSGTTNSSCGVRCVINGDTNQNAYFGQFSSVPNARAFNNAQSVAYECLEAAATWQAKDTAGGRMSLFTVNGTSSTLSGTGTAFQTGTGIAQLDTWNTAWVYNGTSNAFTITCSPQTTVGWSFESILYQVGK